jgi:sulfate adenylyltransferase subunit 1
MMGIRHFIFAINKMDLVGYSEAVYQSICLQCRQAVEGAQGPAPLLIPVAALPGDLVTGPSAHMPWYHGPSILQALEELPVEQDIPPGETCFHVQYVNRPQSANLHDFRGYMGSLLSGEITVGQQVQVFPSQQVTRVKSIRMDGIARQRSFGTGIYTIELDDELDITRGDYLLRSEESGEGTTEFTAQLCWFSEKAGRAGMKVKLQQNSMLTRAIITGILHSVNLDDYSQNAAPEQINLNDLVSVRIRTQQPLPRGEVSNIASLKQAILIDEISHQTLAAILID